MPVEYRKRITRQMIQAEPDVLFVFGDNMIQRGFGGLAKEARGELNSVGIPTKNLPSMAPEAFFSDADFERAEPVISAAFVRLANHLHSGGLVVWPADNIGTGLADLPNKSPKIWRFIQTMHSGIVAI